MPTKKSEGTGKAEGKGKTVAKPKRITLKKETFAVEKGASHQKTNPPDVCDSAY